MVEELKVYFIEELNSIDTSNELKYKGYPDLSGLTDDELWSHANEYGYKEQRQIFYDCYYNRLFYHYYLAEYRKIVLSNDPYFDWKFYNTSEYYALTNYISKCNLSYIETIDISYINPHYSLVSECANYDYKTFPFANGAGQWSSSLFGLIVPSKSILKRGYFMYFYDTYDNYTTSGLSDVYDFNESKTKIRLDFFINGIQSEYYVEETLDPSKNMLGCLFKKKTINGPTITVDYNEIILEENSVISWFCSDIVSTNTSGLYTNYPYNPSRNRFIMILEPYNTRFDYIDNSELLNELKTDIDFNKYNISLKQNKLNAGNNIKIVDNIISVVGVSGVESNFYFVNELRNEIELSFIEINEYISNITFDDTITSDLSGSVDTIITNVTSLETNKQNLITTTSDISLHSLHVFGDLIVEGSFNIIQNDITINNEILITQLDISNQGTGPALNVSQFGSGDKEHVALFNAGDEGDSLLIDSSGNTTIYKNLEVMGDSSLNGVSIQTLDVKGILTLDNININYFIQNVNELSNNVTSLSGSVDTITTNVTSLSGSVDTIISNVTSLSGSVDTIMNSINGTNLIGDKIAISMDICNNYALSISGDIYLNGKIYDNSGNEYIGTSDGTGSNVLTAGDNITIVDERISTTSNITLSNGYLYEPAKILAIYRSITGVVVGSSRILDIPFNTTSIINTTFFERSGTTIVIVKVAGKYKFDVTVNWINNQNDSPKTVYTLLMVNNTYNHEAGSIVHMSNDTTDKFATNVFSYTLDLNVNDQIKVRSLLRINNAGFSNKFTAISLRDTTALVVEFVGT